MNTTTKPARQRQSNIELLRIVSMFLVLMVHFNFLALGNPTLDELSGNRIVILSRVFLESLSICCVNVFILISGYFGIRANTKGVINFLFQCGFFAAIIFLFHSLSSGCISFSGIGVRSILNFNWFIVSYLGLYLISPVLNAFVDNTSKRVQETVLVTFFLFQIAFGFLTEWSKEFNLGYSILSFMGLYLIARYINVWKPKFAQLHKSSYLYIYIGSAILISASWYVCISMGVGLTIFSYNNPLVIIEALALLLLFCKLKINSPIINRIAKSSFAVFLLHTNVFIGPTHIYPFLKTQYSYYLECNNSVWGGVILLAKFFAIMVWVYVISIVLDQLRILLYNVFLKIFPANERK